MIFNSQKEALDQLHILAESDRQSIIIVGPPGSGKSYLSREFANLLNVQDFDSIEPKVSDIREAIDGCINLKNRIVLEIKNLDLGVAAASYTLLKCLEEPMPNLYIVITCRNMQRVPDTIVSRSAVVTLGPPTNNDIDEFGKSADLLKFSTVSSRLVWQCVRSFSDAEEVLKMDSNEIQYYESLSELCKFKDSVSNIIWKLGHYNSGKDCNIELAIRSIMQLMHNPFITKCGIDCLNDLSKARIASHAVLAKFAFNAKFCE